MLTETTSPTPQPIGTVSFPVEGMTCASCVNRITRFIQRVEGVEDANVNLAAETATVRFDPAVVGVGAMDVETAAEARGERDETAANHLGSLRRRLLIATVLTVPLLGGLARMTVAPGLPAVLSDPTFQLLLATPVQLWAGWPFYVGA